VVIHAATNIQQHQDFDVVVAFGHHFDIEVTGIARRAADRVAQIEFQI